VAYQGIIVEAVDRVSKGTENPSAVPRYTSLACHRPGHLQVIVTVFVRIFTHLLSPVFSAYSVKGGKTSPEKVLNSEVGTLIFYTDIAFRGKERQETE